MTHKKVAIMDALVTQLRTMTVANGYNYEPDVVACVDPPVVAYLKNHLHKDHMVLVHEEREPAEEGGGSTCRKQRILVLYVTSFRKFAPVTVDPIDRTERKQAGEEDLGLEPYEIRGNMAEDVEKCLETEGSSRLGGTLLGGRADNINIVNAESVMTNLYNLPEWVVVEHQINLEYATTLGDPTT